MNILNHLILFVIICKIKSQQVLNEELKISTRDAGEQINFENANIERRFLEDLDDHEWHIAHLRTAVWEGREDCIGDTFADKVKRYKRMLRQDGARVEYVSADPLPDPDPAEIAASSCRTKHEINDYTDAKKVSSAMLFNVTKNSLAQNGTAVDNTTISEMADTTPNLDYRATTVKPKGKPLRKKKLDENSNDTLVRRAEGEEYIFSTEEYYDEVLEVDPEMCPDDMEIIYLEIDQLRSYDLVCEMTVEWRSLI